MNLKSSNQLFLVIILVIISGFGGYFLGKNEVKFSWQNYKPHVTVTNQEPPSLADQQIDFKLFWEVFNKVEDTYFDKSKLDAKAMYYGAIQGMVAAIGDPYTMFLPPTQNKQTEEELSGLFEGIGAELGVKDKQIIIVAPIDDSPAQKAGIKAGDWIYKVDGKETYNWTLPDTVNKIRGPKGTKVTLSVVHPNTDKPVDITITRDTITVKSVAWSAKEKNGQKVAYIHISRFGEQTDAEWDKAVSEIVTLRDSNPSAFKGIILDVRNNPGGFLTDAVYIGSEFVKDGNIVQQENAKGERQGYPVNHVGKFLNDPVVVLLNKGSASASEIVSGALRDKRGAKFIGEKSFGKGTVQEAEDVGEGAGLHITTAKWLTPNGTWVNATQGFDPDIPVALDDKNPTVDTQLNRAIDELIK